LHKEALIFEGKNDSQKTDQNFQKVIFDVFAADKQSTRIQAFAYDIGVDRATVCRWAQYKSSPHPLIQKKVITELISFLGRERTLLVYQTSS